MFLRTSKKELSQLWFLLSGDSSNMNLISLSTYTTCIYFVYFFERVIDALGISDYVTSEIFRIQSFLVVVSHSHTVSTNFETSWRNQFVCRNLHSVIFFV